MFKRNSPIHSSLRTLHRLANREKSKKRPRPLLFEPLEVRELLADVSPPAILQWFDSTYDVIEDRTADLFMAGFGTAWLPPPGRADTSNVSVGYDVYDRFDLGGPSNPTLYGTETGLKTVADILDRASASLHVDFVLNHNGYSGTGDDASRDAFQQAGGYPGFFFEFFDDVDGDFNSGYGYGDVQGRLAGLIDIDHSKNYRAIRSPVPGFNNNLAAGTQEHFGRLANVATEENRRFYPDIDHNTIFVFDPITGEQNIPVHQFNLEDPLAGDPVEENALGLLMRNAQWLVQVVGVDGLRIDAAKHVEGFVLDFIDRSVYRQNPRLLLDGSTQHVFSYSEVFDGNESVLLSHVQKSINPNDPGRIGANRDTLDFKLYFALKQNLESTSTQNAWQTIKNSSIDFIDDGLHNGSAGVLFTSNHDVFRPNALDMVANAYVLMQPGNAVVYYNNGLHDQFREQDPFSRFPKISHLEPEADALNVTGGKSDVARLVEIRNTHGRGDYAERWDGTDGLFAFERVSSAITLLSNRGDAGFDSRTLTNVGFAPGTHLIELTGNASSDRINPLRSCGDGCSFRDVPEIITVYEEGGVNKVNVKFQRPNTTDNGGGNDFHGNGYLIYGLPTPEVPAGLEFVSGVNFVMPGGNGSNPGERQTDIHVVQGDQLQVRLQTTPVNLLGSVRDVFADGDNALLQLDGGRDINGNGFVDYVTPGSVVYGFEEFGDKSSPLVGPNGLGDPNWNGDGEFLQTIDTTQLEEGVHFLEARAFRHRTDQGPAVYTTEKQVFYVDRLDPVSAIASFEPFDPGVRQNRDLVIQSVDKTADNVKVFLNIPASITDQQIRDFVINGTPVDGYDLNATGGNTGKIDRDQFAFGYFGVQHGNNVATVVTFEETGRSNVQRLPGLFTDTIVGAGLGDVDFSGNYSPNDIAIFGNLLASNNTQFNPAADLDGDGLIGESDLLALGDRLETVNADSATLAAYDELLDNFFGALDDSLNTLENNVLMLDAPGLLANDNPSSGSMFSITTTGTFTTARGGSVTLLADGAATYDPSGAFERLAPGETATDTFEYSVIDGENNTDTASVTVTIHGVNDAPSFLVAINPSVERNSGPRTISGLAQSIQAEPNGGGAGQVLTFEVTDNTNPGLFADGPALDGTSGNLTFTPATDAVGTATITVVLRDNGGTENGGVDVSTEQSFTIIVSQPLGVDVSFPPILQWFESSSQTMERRAADLFLAGFGGVWTPPPGRSIYTVQGGGIGYDVYDRFDLGGPRDPTLYGTRTDYETMVDAIQRAGGLVFADFIINHTGSFGLRDLVAPLDPVDPPLMDIDGNGTRFAADPFDANAANGGGYPGFLFDYINAESTNGDYHPSPTTESQPGDSQWEFQFQLANLWDLDHRTNRQYVRHPVPGNPDNIPQTGTTPFLLPEFDPLTFTLSTNPTPRLANVPLESNYQFYPDRDGGAAFFIDNPATGETNIPVYRFGTTDDPLDGDPVTENALGLLMRHAQWMIQEVGVDGFRVDAARHVYDFVYDFFDQAVFRADSRTNLDGSPRDVFSFLEAFTGDKGALQSYISKDIDPNNPNTVGGNRDVLDLPFFFALRDNLTGNGFANNWHNIVNASQDVFDDGFANNGSQGVSFVNSHDEEGAHLSNVAHAYMLMRPGNAVVYFNAHEFNSDPTVNERSFPKDGRGDALGGVYGDVIPTLNDIRATHGRGDYQERWIDMDNGFSNFYAFERVGDDGAAGTMLVGLNSRVGGSGDWDERVGVQTSFPEGTLLVEMTGNAADPEIDSNIGTPNEIPEVLVVGPEGKVNLRVPQNVNSSGFEHGNGFVIYGLPTPQGTLNLTNVSQVLASEESAAQTNPTARLAEIEVIRNDTFDIELTTLPVNLLGSSELRDRDADGDFAVFKIDAGIDANGNGSVDFVESGSVTYGFEHFVTQNSPGFFDAEGNGLYRQTIDVSQLDEGVHYLEVRAFRYRDDGGPPVFTSFKKVFYVDRQTPNSDVVSFAPLQVGMNENREALVRSVDLTADNVHVYFNVPAAITNQQILAFVTQGTPVAGFDLGAAGGQSERIDRDLFARAASGVTHGNNVVTVVTFEESGSASVGRFAGQFADTIVGAGLGDIDHSGDYAPADIQLFASLLQSENSQFDAAGDLNGDGLIDRTDLLLLGERLDDVNADAPTQQAYDDLLASLSDPLQVDTVVSSASEIAVHFTDTIDLIALNLYDGDDAANDLADVSLFSPTLGAIAGSLVVDEDRQTLRFIPTGGPLPAGSYTLTLSARTDGIRSSGGLVLDGDEDGNEGGNYVAQIVIAAPGNAVLSLPDFSRSTGQPVELEGTEGIPLAVLSDGTVNELEMILHFDQTTLNISDVALSGEEPGTWTIDLEDFSTPGEVHIRVSGDPPLPASNLNLLIFTASVPVVSSTGARRLWIDSANANQGTLAVTPDTAFHSFGLLGDVTGNGGYSALDAAQIARVAVGLQTGFDAFSWIDPVIVGDATGNKSLSALDAAYVARKAVGLEQLEIPDPFVPLPAPLPVGGRSFSDASLIGNPLSLEQQAAAFFATKDQEASERAARTASLQTDWDYLKSGYSDTDAEVLLATAKRAADRLTDSESDSDEAVLAAESWDAVFSEIGGSID